LKGSGSLKNKLKSIIKIIADQMNYSDIQSAKAGAKVWRDKNINKNKLKGLFYYFEFFYDIVADFLKRKEYVNWKAAAISAAVLIYIINPHDVIPDYIPVIGFSDDLIVIAIFYPVLKNEET
jgi:uncharacterized membrane protein YkvA (DUF1232 family)